MALLAAVLGVAGDPSDPIGPWPSDVLAGWTVGAAFALVVWAVATQLQRHGGFLHRA